MEEPWTILELAELAAETLAVTTPAGSSAEPAAEQSAGPSADDGMPSGPVRANGRVRDVPNERLIRWYVTVGLVDPPLSRRGRVAQYGRRHLLQLVAVKRRQAEGRSLAEIQAELAGATDDALAAVARVPASRPVLEAPAAAPARFWARHSGQPGQPVPAAGGPGQLRAAAAERPGSSARAAAERPGSSARAAAERPGSPARAAAERPGAPVRAAAGRLGAPAPVAAARLRGQGPTAAHGDEADRGAAGSPGGLVHGVRLAPGVTLLLEGAGRQPGPDDVTEIVNAARPLLAELASRRLCASGPGQPPDDPGRSPEVGSSPRGARHDH